MVTKNMCVDQYCGYLRTDISQDPLNPKWVHCVYVKTLIFIKFVSSVLDRRHVKFQFSRALTSLNASPSPVPVTRDVCVFMGAQFRCHCLPLPPGRRPPPNLSPPLCWLSIQNTLIHHAEWHPLTSCSPNCCFPEDRLVNPSLFSAHQSRFTAQQLVYKHVMI